MLVCIIVNANQEEKVKRILEKEVGDEYEFIVPTKEFSERKNGKWHIVKRKLFPGYVLIKGIINIEVYYKFKEVRGIIKLLRDEDEILTVYEKELKILFDDNNNIGISTLYKQNNSMKIITGSLLGLEGQIVKVNSRKGRAKVNLSFMNEERIVELGIELVDKI